MNRVDLLTCFLLHKRSVEKNPLFIVYSFSVTKEGY